VSLSREDTERALLRKLKMRLDDRRDHRFYELYVDDLWILQTKISTGTKYRQLGDALVGKIAKEPRISPSELRAIVRCTIDRDRYLRLLRDRGVL
jgi:hypothetical protein